MIVDTNNTQKIGIKFALPKASNKNLVNATFQNPKTAFQKLTKPISTVASSDRGYGTTPSHVVTTYDKRDRRSGAALSKEPETQRKSFLGVLVEKVVTPFIVVSPKAKKAKMDMVTTMPERASGEMGDLWTLGSKISKTAFENLIRTGENIILRARGLHGDLKRADAAQHTITRFAHNPTPPEIQYSSKNDPIIFGKFDETPLSRFSQKTTVGSEPSNLGGLTNTTFSFGQFIFFVIIGIVLLKILRG